METTFMSTPLGVGILGCGNISDIYFKNLTTRFPWLEVRACCDLDPERSGAKEATYGVKAEPDAETLLAREDISMVLNLSTPPAHAPLNQMILEAGKHAYVEKPFALTVEDAKQTLGLAKQKGLLVGCAPDTFLGAGIQTARRVIDEGRIGKVVSCNAYMMCPGHESWHPDPEFYYAVGGGPMLDMGPYYITALVTCVGPVNSVSGMTGAAFEERTITSEKKHGQKIPVETPTHLAGTMLFENGAIGTIVTSFDVFKTTHPRIEIHGTEGSLIVPDPNTFTGEVLLSVGRKSDWESIEIQPETYAPNSRGIGLADLALAIRDGRVPRASGELAAHVLDVMLAFERSSSNKAHIEITQFGVQPEPLPAHLSESQPW
jgi:predicted dehydrogenase